jgi:hypothetical protein
MFGSLEYTCSILEKGVDDDYNHFLSTTYKTKIDIIYNIMLY